MAKKIVIIDVEESLEDKVKKYKARFHIMTFVSLFLILGFIICETKSTEKLSQEMNKHNYNYYDVFDDEEVEQIDLISNIPVIKSNATSNIKSNSNSNTASTKKVEEVVSKIKSNLNVEKIVTPTKSTTKTTTTKSTEVGKAIEVKEEVSNFQNDSWDKIINNIKSNNYTYKVGDIKSIVLNMDGEDNTYKLKITNITNDTHEFTIEFIDSIYIDIEENYPTIWTNSNTRNYLNTYFYELLPSSLNSSIINTKVVVNNNDEELVSEDKIYISNLNEIISLEDYTEGNKISVKPIFRIG